jgi:uncharacterized cupredoxin-like copper-binding protein
MRVVLASLTACLFLAGCAMSHPIDPQIAPASTSFANAEKVAVTLSNFDFTPSTIHLKAGRPYALVLTNTADGGHDFAAPEFFAAAKIEAGDAASVAKGEVELEGRQSATVHLVPAAGEYDLVCTHAGHALLGMKGKIVVD